MRASREPERKRNKDGAQGHSEDEVREGRKQQEPGLGEQAFWLRISFALRQLSNLNLDFKGFT